MDKCQKAEKQCPKVCALYAGVPVGSGGKAKALWSMNKFTSLTESAD